MKDDNTTEVAELEDRMKKILVNRNDDYEYARELLYISAEKLQDVLESAVDLARESEHPRAQEVAKDASVALADIAGKMLDQHLKVERLNNPKGDKAETVNQSVNVKLNTKDLLELLGKE